MDKEFKRMVYIQALSDTLNDRKKLFELWKDLPSDVTDGEADELNENLKRLEKVAGRSAIITSSVLSAALEGAKWNLIVDKVNKDGYEMMPADDEDE